MVALLLAPAVGALGPALDDATDDVVPAGAQTVPDADCAVPRVDDKCETWTAGGTLSAWAELIASPDGQRVYTERPAAYDAQTGEHLWTGSYDGDAEWAGGIAGLDLGPDGEVLVNTATGADANGTRVYRTTAWNATSGERLWAAPLDVEGRSNGLSIGPDGDRVYVTGNGGTVAYDLATGQRVWLVGSGESAGAAWNGGGFDIFAGPDGDRVYVGVEAGDGHRGVGLNASTGDHLWTAVVPDTQIAQLYSVSLSPDGETLVLGMGSYTRAGYVAVIDTGQGTVRWDAHMGGTVGTSGVIPWTTTVGPDSGTVYAAASPRGSGVSTADSFVIAFDAPTGDVDWIHRKPGPHMFGNEQTSLGVAPDGQRVYVASGSYYTGHWRLRSDLTTEALDGDTGASIWQATYNADPTYTGGAHWPAGVAVSPDGSRVYSSLSDAYGYVSSYVSGEQPPGVLAYDTAGPDTQPPSGTGGSS